jgi:hypothetical protein
MTPRIRDDLSARLLAHVSLHGEDPTGGTLDDLIEQTAAATGSDSADVRRVYERDLRIMEAI